MAENYNRKEREREKYRKRGISGKRKNWLYKLKSNTLHRALIYRAWKYINQESSRTSILTVL